MKKIIYLLLFTTILIPSKVRGADNPLDKIQKLKWDGLEVIYLEDDSFPTYSLTVYFADGALSDGSIKGVAEGALSFMSLGTRRYSRSEIASNLEYFGATFGSNTTHEYSTYSVSGLVKDVQPTLKKICHLFKDATFPQKDLDKEKKRLLDSIENIISNPNALASRVFREVSMGGSPYAYPTDGKKGDVKKWSSKILKERLTYFNEKVKKRIYLTGPREVLKAQNIINNDCGWTGKGSYERTVSYEKVRVENGPQITLVPINGNQAQVRIGRFLNADDLFDPELTSLASNYLGGGFTSQLMQELRVKGGLTYGVYSFAGGQKQYGRAGVSTSTAVSVQKLKDENQKDFQEYVQKLQASGKFKGPQSLPNQSTHPKWYHEVRNLDLLLTKTKEVLKKAGAGEINPETLMLHKGALAGSYLFGFESSSAFLQQLSYLDHIGRPYSSLVEFPDKVNSYDTSMVGKAIQTIFNWEDGHIVVIGPRSLQKDLRKFGKVSIRNYKDFL